MVSVLLATTGRPEMAKRCIETLLASTKDHDVQIVAAVDVCGKTAIEANELGCLVDYSDEYRGCSRAWNDALALSSGDPVVLAADDLVWGQGWLDAALRCMEQHPDGWGMVGFNDGHWQADLSTHYMLSRRFIVEELGGVIAWEHYLHSFNDREVNERAKLAGRYAWCADAYVHHEHWNFGERPLDATDSRKLDAHPESQRTFEARMAAGFPNDYPPVIKQ